MFHRDSCCSHSIALDFTVLLQMAQEVGSQLLKRLNDLLQPPDTQALGPNRTTASLFT